MLSGSDLFLVIVSEDWFARSVLESLAAESGEFAKIIAVDDGYSALAETWQGVEDGHVPNVFLVDLHSVGPSSSRLVAELRADPVTSSVYIGVLTPEEPVAKCGVDFATACLPSQPEVADALASLASRARVSLQAGRAA